MRLRYDFHLHSCLSPCGDEDMTPYNLVNMAALLELEIIALTDHNSTGNCRSAVAAGLEAGITVVPGMELCTSEEIHVVCLFPDCDRADSFWGEIRATLPPIKNKPEVFGNQLYMDSADGVLGSEDILLVTASGIGIDQVREVCARHGGICYPAHIDRSSFSILASLGVIEPELGFTCAEISKHGDVERLRAQHPALGGMRVMRSSDAHRLEDMTEAADTIDLPQNSAQALISYLKSL